MKTRIATGLSVVGVLAAGSAAALVNTQILEGGAAESSASAAVLPTASTVDVSVPDETLPPDTTTTTIDDSATSTIPSTVPSTLAGDPDASQSAPEASDYLTAFNVGDSGVVTVDVIEGELVLIKAEAKPGWTVTDTNEDGNEVEVDFSTSTVRVEFEAVFVDGQIVPSVNSKRLGGSTAPAGTLQSAPNTTIADEDDGYHDDEYDDDEYDDDEYDDDEYDDDEEDDEEDDDDEEDEEDDEDRDDD